MFGQFEEALLWVQELEAQGLVDDSRYLTKDFSLQSLARSQEAIYCYSYAFGGSNTSSVM
jgi:hypothetical protein